MNTEFATESTSSILSGQYTISVNPPTEIIHTNPENTDYIILNTSYKKDDIITDEELCKYYSVIVKASTNEILSVAPQIPIPFVEFAALNPEMTDDIEVVQMSEGTMIQLFYDPSIGDWEIATRGRIGGNHWHYRTEYIGMSLCAQKTFRQMFYDAIENCALVGTPAETIDEQFKVKSYQPTMPPDYNSPLSDNPFIQQLDKQYCYYFVLKHPANPIVHFVWSPNVMLIAANKITPTDKPHEYCVHVVRPSDLPTLIPSRFKHIIHTQQSVRNQLYGETLYDQAQSYMFLSQPGLMFIDTKTGKRAILENPDYLRDLELRGNHSNLQYQFFELRRECRLDEFIRRFKHFAPLFQQFINVYASFTMNVYNAYYRYYILHEEVEHRYHRYAIKIHHAIYKPALSSGTRILITPEIVLKYFDAMTTSQIMYILNQDQVYHLQANANANAQLQ